jgi:hypothetical protein
VEFFALAVTLFLKFWLPGGVFLTYYSKNMGKTESNQIRGENLVWSCEV